MRIHTRGLQSLCRAAVIGAVLGVSGLGIGVSGASARGKAGGECLESGTAMVNASGPLLIGDRTASLTFTGSVFGCRTPDRTIHSGSVVGSATISFDCSKLGGTDTGEYTIAWNNGRKSVVTYTEQVLAGVGHTTGVVIHGEFKGMKTWDHDLDLPSPAICLSSAPAPGIWNGITGIGAPDPAT